MKPGIAKGGQYKRRGPRPLRQCLLLGVLAWGLGLGLVGLLVGIHEQGVLRGLAGFGIGALVGLPVGLGGGVLLWLRSSDR